MYVLYFTRKEMPARTRVQLHGVKQLHRHKIDARSTISDQRNHCVDYYYNLVNTFVLAVHAE
jgi:hypothetical protein